MRPGVVVVAGAKLRLFGVDAMLLVPRVRSRSAKEIVPGALAVLPPLPPPVDTRPRVRLLVRAATELPKRRGP